MSIFVIFVFIDVDILGLGRLIVLIIVLFIHEYLLVDWIIIVRFGLHFRHLHPFTASWSRVVMEKLVVF